VFDELNYGYYLVTSSLGAFVSVDSTQPNATVIDKNQKGPSSDDEQFKTVKKVGEDDSAASNSVNYGDVLEYTIDFTATNYDGEDVIKEYTISDVLTGGLQYVDLDQIAVTVTQNGSDAQEKALTTDDYTITSANDGKSFEMTIAWATENTPIYTDSPSEITITYQAKVVDDNAVIAGTTGNTNTAKISYKAGNSDTAKETLESSTTTYTYALAILKTDDANNPLEDAHFSIKNAEGTELYGILTDDGYYKYAASSDTDATKEFVSDKNGQIVLKGVEEGEYTITETQAPAGYNQLTESVTIEAQQDTKDTTYNTSTITTYLENGVVVDQKTDTTTEATTTLTSSIPAASKQIVNTSGSVLPSTGGMGTKLFYIIGAALVIGAGVVLVVRRRMGEDE
jgi:LPXTG-motif cell wall-anchored protein